MSEYLLSALAAIWIAGLLSKSVIRLLLPSKHRAYEMTVIPYAFSLVIIFGLSILVAYAYEWVL